MDGCNWRRTNLISMKTEMIKTAILKKIPLKILDHCNCPPKIMSVLLKCMAASAQLKLKNALEVLF